MKAARHALGAVAATTAGAGAVIGATLLCRAAAGDLLREVASSGWAGLAFDTLLAGLAALVLAVGAGWLGLATVLTVTDLLTGLGHTVCARVTPRFVRRLVAVVCGAALGGTTLGGTTLAGAALGATPPGEAAAGGAVAGPVRAGRAPGATSLVDTGRRPAAAARLLTGLPLPDRPLGPGAVLGATRSRASVHVVRPGESLWSVTARALGPGAGSPDVADGWRLLYAINRERVGRDPDLLLPGTTLRLPGAWPAGRAPRPRPHGEDPS